MAPRRVAARGRRHRRGCCVWWRDGERRPELALAVHFVLFLFMLSFVAAVRAFDVHDRQLLHACVSCSRRFSVMGALHRHYRRDHPGTPFWDLPGASQPVPEPAVPASDVVEAPPPSEPPAPLDRGEPTVPFERRVNEPTAVAGQILAYYREFGDLATVRPVVEPVEGGRPQVFNTPTLKMFRSFALSVGGAGLSGPDRELFWENIVTAEREALRGTDAANTLGPMEAAFPSASKFKTSLRCDADRCMQELKWMVADIKTEGQTATFYFRDLMTVLLDAAQNAKAIQLHGERRRTDDGHVLRSGTLDSDVYLAEQEDVMSDARHSGIANKFVMAVQMFSDSALVSWSGGACVRSALPSVCFCFCEPGLTVCRDHCDTAPRATPVIMRASAF